MGLPRKILIGKAYALQHTKLGVLIIKGLDSCAHTINDVIPKYLNLCHILFKLIYN
jgi:hypothetical protein